MTITNKNEYTPRTSMNRRKESHKWRWYTSLASSWNKTGI
jgi:hypothetical protein